MNYSRDAIGANFNTRVSYPQTFRIRTASRVLAAFISMILGFGLMVLIKVMADLPSIGVGLVIIALLITAFLGLMLRLLTVKLVVDEREIRVSSLFGRRIVDRMHVVGYICTNPQFSRLQLRGGKAVVIDGEMFRSARAATWLGELPDARALAEVEFLKQLSTDTALGADVDARIKVFDRTKLLVNALQIASFLLFLFQARNSGVAIGWCSAAQIILPLIALGLVAINPKLLRLGVVSNDPRPTVAMLLVIPALGLLLISGDLDVLDRYAAWPGAVAVAVLLGVAMFALYRNEPGGGIGRVVGVAIFGLTYGFSATLLADVLLDRAPSASYPTMVTNHSISSGKSLTYYLEIAPWGPRLEREQLVVSSATYYATPVRSTVCMRLHPGALNLPWAGMGACP